MRAARTIRWWSRFSLYLLVVICVLAHVRWVPEIISPHVPLQVPTPGSVGESLHCLWKWVHGLPVYADPTKIPYACAYFNWLFYASYGEACRLLIRWAALSDDWIPSIGSLLTLTLAAGGAVVAGRVFHRTMPKEAGGGWDAAALGFLLFAGPHALGWNLSARPDIGALLCECLGVGLSFAAINARSHSSLWWAASGMAFAAAWSMRVINIGCLCGVLVWLMGLRRWANGLQLAMPVGVVAVLCFVSGGRLWFENAVLVGAYSPFGLKFAFVTAFRSLAKGPYGIVAVGAAAWFFFQRRWRFDSPKGLWSVLVASTFFTAWFTSAKEGSDQNYWFSFYFVALGLLATLWNDPDRGMNARARAWLDAMIVICLLFTATVQLAYATGNFRIVDTRANARLAGLRTVLKGLPGPVLVCGEFYGNLPWITGHEPPFVCGWTYPQMEQRGVEFEGGGLRGLMDRGYFGTIVCPRGYAVESMVGGATAAAYEWKLADEHYDYHVIRTGMKWMPGAGH